MDDVLDLDGCALMPPTCPICSDIGTASTRPAVESGRCTVDLCGAGKTSHWTLRLAQFVSYVTILA